MIISGDENISSIEIADLLYTHPDMREAAVVAMANEKWGETPCAFVTLNTDAVCTEQALIDWYRDKTAHFKCATKVIFDELPKTSTGKIQKFLLQEKISKKQ